MKSRRRMWITIGQTMQRSDDITLWQDNEQPFCDAKSFEPPRRVWVITGGLDRF
jgi:hypothetical protein